jgi:hypothetical protein
MLIIIDAQLALYKTAGEPDTLLPSFHSVVRQFKAKASSIGFEYIDKPEELLSENDAPANRSLIMAYPINKGRKPSLKTKQRITLLLNFVRILHRLNGTLILLVPTTIIVDREIMNNVSVAFITPESFWALATIIEKTPNKHKPILPSTTLDHIERTAGKGKLELKTRVFDLQPEYYRSLTEMAKAMGISVSQVYRVLEGKRRINQRFILGAVRAFPGYMLDDLFYVERGK